MDGVAAPLWHLINEKRAASGMTWTTLESRSHVYRSTVAKWKTARRPPHAQTVIAIATVLDIDLITALRAGGVIANELEGLRLIDPALQRIREDPDLSDKDKRGAIDAILASRRGQPPARAGGL